MGVTVNIKDTNVVEVNVPGPRGPQGFQGPAGSPGTTTWAGITGKPTTVAGFGITDAEKTTSKGIANGYAGLDGTGKVPAGQLPSYVDDVLEFANLAAFPATGETGKIYIALDTNFAYRWSGSTYTRIVASPGSTDALAEGTTNLYFTPVRVLASVITGLSTATNAVITASDTVLSALGKLQAQVSARVLKSGDTMTGGLTAPTLSVDGAAGSNRLLSWFTAGVARWRVNADTSAESGGNVGTNWVLNRYSDAGVFIDTVLSFARSTGVAVFTYSPVLPTPSAGDNSTKGATTAFVQGEFAARAGVNSGLATLDSSGKVLTSQLPPLAINDVFTVATQAAMLALTAQRGDVAIRTDTTSTYILSTDSPSTLADWKQILNPTGAISTVFGRTGTVVSANGDYTATQITNTPAGNIGATTVQAAINELDSEKQPLDADLTAIAGLTTAANKLAYATGAGTWALTDFSPFGRTLVDDTDAAAARATMGLTAAATMVASVGGTWTPALKFGGNAVGLTTSTLIGSYTRVGDLVYYFAYIALSAKGSSTGAVTITGIPFTPPTMTSIPNVFAATGMVSWAASKGVLNPTTNIINIYLSGNTNDTAATDANFSNTSVIVVQGVLSLGSLT